MLKKYEEYKIEFGKMENGLERKLTKYASEFLENEYGLELAIPIKFNGRLSKSVGRFRYNDYHNRAVEIELSKKHTILAVMTNTLDAIFGVLKHELIHYALFEKDLPYYDSDLYFQNECKRHNAPLRHDGYYIRQVYHCENGHLITRGRKFNENNYSCNCGASIRFTKTAIYRGKKEVKSA